MCKIYVSGAIHFQIFQKFEWLSYNTYELVKEKTEYYGLAHISSLYTVC